MKRTLALAGLSILVCAAAAAQERVVVPARNTSHPRQVIAHTLNRSITVKTYEGKEVIVELGGSDSRQRQRPDRRAPDTTGMKRLDVPRGLDITEDDNVITIKSSITVPGALTITVPVDTSLSLKTLNGTINVDGVHGEVVASSHNGHIELTNISGTIVADSFNAPIHATMDRVDQGKPLAFSTFNSRIDVTFPADLKATTKFKVDRGDIYSDFDLTAGGPTMEPDNSGQGKYRIRFDHGMTGKINGGGVDISFHSFNGSIYLRKKK